MGVNNIFQLLNRYGHENLFICHHPEANLKAIIGVHNTVYGPAAGGIRTWEYPDEAAAINDAILLSRMMTYKFAVSGLPVGGGKCVVMLEKGQEPSEEMYRILGRYIERLNGLYIAAAWEGKVHPDFMKYVVEETAYAFELSESPEVTAYGVYTGIKACLDFFNDKSGLNNKVVAVQGVGSVGAYLCELLVNEGAQLIVADLDQNKAQQAGNKFGARVVDPGEITGIQCDILCPCAHGNVVTTDNVKNLRCKIIAGSANNQLSEEKMGLELHKRNIFYAPDFVINAGGAIFGVLNIKGKINDYDYLKKEVGRRVYQNLAALFQLASDNKTSNSEAAYRLAEKRMENFGIVSRVQKEFGIQF